VNAGRFIATGVLLLAFVSRVNAASLFEESTVLEMELIGPIKELTRDKAGEQEMPFSLRADGVDHAIDVRLRGNSRRRVCSFPPLRLNLKTKASANTVFADQDKLKLVTHCKEGSAFEQDLLKEYIAYRIFNMLSDESYRVRLVRINYIDSDPRRAGKTLKRYAYLLESDEELAARISATKLARTGVSLSSLDVEQASLVYVFQYLIGNTDWSLVKADTKEFCCHNTDLFEIDSKLVLVPYDFDLSGLVNAPYAKPDPALRINSVRKRLYRGYCLATEDLTNALESIVAKQSDIASLPSETPGLSSREKEGASRYLRAFFKDVSDIEKVVRNFDKRCL
jgi:hypothetical protein